MKPSKNWMQESQSGYLRKKYQIQVLDFAATFHTGSKVCGSITNIVFTSKQSLHFGSYHSNSQFSEVFFCTIPMMKFYDFTCSSHINNLKPSTHFENLSIIKNVLSLQFIATNSERNIGSILYSNFEKTNFQENSEFKVIVCGPKPKTSTDFFLICG